ncbi:toxin-antitoxin system TumE family protein [Shinella zoogloeoides]|uniref:toxin-antitoxin system TumE family protein n=1 Tax=Shinella zoogloeoides TaxID=352475 RepID=UPI0032AFF63F
MFADLVIWRVPEPLRGSPHLFKYRLAFVADGICVMRYDNEAGKGDHKHIGAEEHPYVFQSIEKLLLDFDADMKGWIDGNADRED